MPLRKISEPSRKERCLSPEHNPPDMIVLEPGTYEHKCPSCGHGIIFKIPLITCSTPIREIDYPGYISKENNKWISSKMRLINDEWNSHNINL